MRNLNVSECHLCRRCPRLLAYQTKGADKAWQVGLQGGGVFTGTLFHDTIAKPFHLAMCQGSANAIFKAVSTLLPKPAPEVTDGLSGVMDHHILEPLLAEKGAILSTAQITALANGMHQWAANLAAFLCQNRERQPAGELGDLFCPPEKKLSASMTLPQGNQIRLRGRLGSLMIDQTARRAVIVEFKGLRPANADEDLIQVALYALLLTETTGISPRAVVLYLDEGGHSVHYDARTLSGMRADLLPLMQTATRVKGHSTGRAQSGLGLPSDVRLCGQCPFDPLCDRDWGLRTASPSPEKQTQEENQEAEALMQKLIDTLKDIKLPAEPRGYVLGPRLVRLKIKPILSKGATAAKIESQVDNLQSVLSTKLPPLIQTTAGHMTIDLPRKTTTPLTLGEVWERGLANKPNAWAAFPMGMAVDGSIFWARLSDAAMTSILVAGTAGSGKSVLLRSAILGMARNAGPERLRITLIDPKLISFMDFSEIPHLHGGIIFKIKRAVEILKSLVDEMEWRYDVFAQNGVLDIGGYFRKGYNMPHHVVVIDEYADLMAEKKRQEDVEKLIQRLCQKGRAAGFHIILSTQRPDPKTVTPIIKANLQLKVALKVTTASNSTVILDSRGAEHLMGNGDMLVGGAVPLMRLQGPLATKTDLELVLKGQP